MNLISYIEKYGNKTFDDKPLNEVDKLILSNLSYVDFKHIVAKNSFIKIRLEEAGEEFFSNNYDKGKKILAVKGGIKLLKAMYKTARYKDLLLFNYESIINDVEQFSALSIEIKPKLVYVSFEGTDDLVIGWKEDFEMCYKFPVKSQRSAINYMNAHFTFKDCKLILGGHSKGGNLSLVAAMYSNFLVRNKIIEIYSYDGQGLLEEQLNSSRYKKIEDRFIHVIPNNSVVGLMLYSTNNRVIKTNYVGVLSHFALNWQVDENDLIDDELKKSSIDLKNRMDKWLEKYNKEEKEKFVEEIFEVFNKNNITSLMQIAHNPKMFIKLLNDTSKVDSTASIMFKEFVDMVRTFFFKNVKEKITKK